MNLSEWERKNFINSYSVPDVTVIFPSREIYFSNGLLNLMRFKAETCPKTLDQWYELCHPSDHSKISKLENLIYGHEDFLSITRKLYCGDGYYRNFRLDASVYRAKNGKPEKLTGSETPALTAWLENASEGDLIEITDYNGRIKTLEAVRISGVMTLNDLSVIEDLQHENLRLRHEIQRRIFSPYPSEIILPDSDGSESFFKNILDETVNSALDIMTANNQLKSLRRSLNETDIIIGIAGLTSSGKSSFMNALLGEKLIPEQTRATTNIPIICREGETRSAKILYQDGRQKNISGQKLTSSYMNNIASETFNAGNRKGISRIELSIPGALIPKGICFADTPGYDALANYGGTALKNILPELDFIIYITPVRANLKNADYEYLKLILSINDNLIFALSQIDLERDDSEAGKIIHSADEKILTVINSIRTYMKNNFGLKVEVVPVSSKNALEKFYDRNSNEWRSSNIESIVEYIEPLGQDPLIRSVRLRAQRALKILENSELKGSSAWRLNEIRGNLKKILASSPTPSKISKTLNINKDSSLTKSVKHEKNLLSSLITSMKEREFKTEFFNLKAFEGKNGKNGKRKAVLLGADRKESMKLFSRLAHNILLEDFTNSNSEEWLCTGQVMPFNCVKLTVNGFNENILIAPSNSLIKNKIDWQKLFREYIPVVSIDLARVDSGLSDLAYSPYSVGLAVSKWILAFGNAGLFDTRRQDLISEVPKRVKMFTELNGLKNPDWFIFENYKIF